MDRKEEKKKVSKARDIIGTNYFIIILLIDLVPTLFFKNILGDNVLLLNVLSCIWYIILPFVGVYLLKMWKFKKLKSYITQENYKKIRNYTILYLTVIGFIYVICFVFIVELMIPVLIGYVLSSIYLIKEMKKLSKEV